MRRRRLDVIVLIVSAALFLLIGYERGAVTQHRKPSVFSTYDTGPNGYRALYDVLMAGGLPVRRFEGPLGMLEPSIRTLIITSYGFEDFNIAHPLNERDAALLKDFVKRGGRLVAIDSEFAGIADAAPAVGSTVLAAGRGAVAVAHNALTEGVVRVDGPVEWIFPYSEKRGVPLLANAQGIVGMWYRYGRGDVIAITAPKLFGNAALRNGDNLRFIYNAIVSRGGEIAFDEYVHGYSDGPTLWGVLPGAVRAALWIVLAIAAIALIGGNVPFAPPFLPQRSDERTSSGYITAIAELMRRSRRRPPDDDVLWNAQLQFRNRKEHA